MEPETATISNFEDVKAAYASLQIQEFDSSFLQNELILQAGRELNLVSENTTNKVNEQIEQAKSNISVFREIIASLSIVDKGMDDIRSSMQQVVRGSDECRREFDKVSERMDFLETQFSTIHKLLRQVNSIADKTRLLSLNARIEANKAGENGRTFSVVANEVSDLSMTTKATNNQIQETMTSIGDAIKELGTSIQHSKKTLEKSEETISDSDRSIENISAASENFRHQVQGSMEGFLRLEESSEVVRNEMRELNTIGDTFKYLIELIMQGANSAGLDPLERLLPLVKASNFNDASRFTKTEDEYVLTESDVLISATDPRGIITFANNKFYEVAQFPFGSLVGKPHNCIRHADMPKSAFADLWAVIAAGKLWQGYVKNIGAEGRVYWVKANVFPCYQDGQIVGYISIRTKPSPEKIETATGAYRLVP